MLPHALKLLGGPARPHLPIALCSPYSLIPQEILVFVRIYGCYFGAHTLACARIA